MLDESLFGLTETISDNFCTCTEGEEWLREELFGPVDNWISSISVFHWPQLGH
jgi:hypothetical protein